MTFSSGAEFLAFIETHKPTLGDMLECTILTPDNRRIDKILAAEVIQGPIPYHHPQPVHIPESEQWRVKENIVWCVDALTGQEWFEPT